MNIGRKGFQKALMPTKNDRSLKGAIALNTPPVAKPVTAAVATAMPLSAAQRRR